jgi:hypothetical protein
MNVEIGSEAAQFPKNEYINGIFVAVHYNYYNRYHDIIINTITIIIIANSA